MSNHGALGYISNHDLLSNTNSYYKIGLEAIASPVVMWMKNLNFSERSPGLEPLDTQS